MTDVDVVLRQGLVHDGSGGSPWIGDVAIAGDRIVGVGPGLDLRGAREYDVSGLAVAPGFINMMSWAVESLIEDGRSMSGVLQGVTLEVMGEGTSMGPLTVAMRRELAERGLNGGGSTFRYPVPWTTLCEYLTWLEARGVSTNVASFVGAGTLRVHEAGYADRPLHEREITRMCELLDREMRDGALGVASALIYPPETAYLTDELVRLAAVVARHGGMYASHIRGEGSTLIEAVRELLEIARVTGVRAEVFHLKASGRSHWPALTQAIDLIESARADGLKVTADLYPYEYSGTSLTVCLPPWAHEGGPSALRARLRDDRDRARIRADLSVGTWENPWLDAGPDGIQVRGPLHPSLVHLAGCSVAEIAVRLGTDPHTAVMDLVRDHPNDIFALYFDMDPAGVQLVARQPWVSFCSDAESLSVEAATRQGGIHPRAFGSFARVLGRLVRDDGALTLAEAVRRMTSLPARNLGLLDRGRLRPGCHADVVVLDGETISDHATPEQPAVYATGIVHVLVNGVPVVRHGVHTGALPGRFVRGPGSNGRAVY